MSSKKKTKSFEWNADQKDAIDARDGTLIVSAAAGSGKTTVLVERIIRRLTDSKNPCDANRLLIVTFTRAATAEMRSRISKALTQALQENPNDENLQKQQMLLPSAKIFTIDAFCMNLVRENFETLGISPDFTPLDETEGKVIAKQVVSSVIDKLYEENSKEFKDLVELLFSGNSDTSLESHIIKLYNYSQAYPSPKKWLEDSISCYDSKIPLWESKIGQVISSAASSCLEKAIENAEFSIDQLSDNDDYKDAKGLEYLKTDCAQCKRIKALIDSCKFDEAIASLDGLTFPTWNMPKGFSKTPEATRAKAARDACKTLLTDDKGIRKYFCESEAELLDDMDFLRPLAKKLIEAVGLFEEEFMKVKLEKNVFDFSDITHLALKLLVKDLDSEKLEPTDLAKYLSEQFEEILIDEYQDTNKAQDTIFRAISRNENNLFMVGDVKQSIYGFRQAMPELFLEKKKSFTKYDSKNPKYPAYITLGQNFRSRKGITEYVNFVFEQLMCSEVGNIDYDESERLVCGASYDAIEEPEVEFYAIDKSSEIDALENEANLIAKYISHKVDHCGEKYGDFSILLQSAKDRAPVIEKVLKDFGIPVYTDAGNSYLKSADVSTIVSLLKTIDNPLQDIPLLATLMSPIFGFTPDSVSQLKIDAKKHAREIGSKDQSLYAAVLYGESKGDKRCIEFLEKLRFYRRLSISLSAGELIRKIYEDTLFPYIVSAMPNGVQRNANLLLLQDYADSFDGGASFGISSFIRYIDKLMENDVEPNSATVLSENANVVRIMSIHKSKGLEFKYCILANTASQFNEQDLRQPIILHSSLGIGLRGRDIVTGNTYPTMINTALKLALKKDKIAEYLRVLYVALTRAKEHLVVIGTFSSKTDAKIQKCENNILTKKQLHPYTIQSSSNFFDLLLTTTLRHPSAKILRDISGGDCPLLPADFKINVQHIEDMEYFDFEAPSLASEEAQAKNLGEESKAKIDSLDEELIKDIEERISYEYPYAALANVATKQAASKQLENVFDDKFFATAKPSFASKDHLTPAERGTALHTFMQYANFQKLENDFEEELERVKSKGFLNDRTAAAVEKEKVLAFVHSNIGKRIFASDNVMREEKFSILAPARKFNKDLKGSLGEEQVFLQGIADCIFEEDGGLVLVDYKTDRGVTEQDLIDRHTSQLMAYKEVLSECEPLPITEAYVYSFYLGKEVKVL